MGAAEGQEAAKSHSGRLLLRMPEGLHAALANASEREGTSLNAFITATLAAAVGWEAGGGSPKRQRPAAPSSAVDRPRRPLVERLLVANLVVVGIVGVLAIVLLVHALG
jgi:hypothetical protein